jgi:hypothetical protein
VTQSKLSASTRSPLFRASATDLQTTLQTLRHSRFVLLWEHSVQQRVSFLLLFRELIGPLLNQTLQIVSVLLHDGQHVIKDVGFEASLHLFEPHSHVSDVRSLLWFFVPARFHTLDYVVGGSEIIERGSQRCISYLLHLPHYVCQKINLESIWILGLTSWF